VFAVGTLVKDSLTFINRSHLHSVVADFGGVAPDTGFLNGLSHGVLVGFQGCLFFITLCPDWRRSNAGVSGGTWRLETG
jgi:hypothetical protein